MRPSTGASMELCTRIVALPSRDGHGFSTRFSTTEQKFRQPISTIPSTYSDYDILFIS